MKKITAFFLALLLSLMGTGVLAEALPAEEEGYTHPARGYSFHVPEGWLMVDKTNIETYIAAYEQGEMAFTGTNAQTLQQLLPRVQQLDCVVLIDPFANNAVFVTESLGTLQTNEQFTLLMMPMLKSQLSKSMPGMEFTSEGELLKFGENEFISLCGTYQMNGLSVSLDQLYILEGTLAHCISLTVTNLFGQQAADAFYTEISNVLASFALAAK